VRGLQTDNLWQGLFLLSIWALLGYRDDIAIDRCLLLQFFKPVQDDGDSPWHRLSHPHALVRLSATPGGHTRVPRASAGCEASPANVASRQVGGGAPTTRRRVGCSRPPAPRGGSRLALAASAPGANNPASVGVRRLYGECAQLVVDRYFGAWHRVPLADILSNGESATTLLGSRNQFWNVE
jgi:hypothetical protein